MDDMPYVIGLAMDIPLDLHKEYKGILKMYKEGDVSIPVKAFLENCWSDHEEQEPILWHC